MDADMLEQFSRNTSCINIIILSIVALTGYCFGKAFEAAGKKKPVRVLLWLTVGFLGIALASLLVAMKGEPLWT